MSIKESYDPFILSVCVDLYQTGFVKLQGDLSVWRKQIPAEGDGERWVTIDIRAETRTIKVFYDFGEETALNAVHYITFNELEDYILAQETSPVDKP